MRPPSYANLAANDAEKAARIKLVDYRMIGATGRLYLSGSEADVRQAAGAAEDALLARGDETLIPPRPPREGWNLG
jgi:microcompartment protein CcmL/EutN